MCLTAVRAAQVLDAARLAAEAVLAELDAVRAQLELANKEAQKIAALGSPDDRNRRRQVVQLIAAAVSDCYDATNVTDTILANVRDVEQWIDNELSGPFDPPPPARVTVTAELTPEDAEYVRPSRRAA